MTYKTLTSWLTFTGVITMCLARVEVLHERIWHLVGCLSPQRRQVHVLLMVKHEGVQHQRWCKPLLYQNPILPFEWAGRWMGIGSRGSSIHLSSAEVDRWNTDALRHPIAALSEEVEQYFETPNQALISRPWTSFKKIKCFIWVYWTESICGWRKNNSEK